jgi:thioesterase domain-containing protein
MARREAPKADLEAFTDFMRRSIPLAQAMDVRVSAWTAEHLTLVCPLEPNGNPHGTAFGGSIATLGLLCGWAWLHLQLAARCAVVVQRSDCRFLLPARGGLTAISRYPGDEAMTRFRRMLDRGRGRVAVLTDILSRNQPVAEHSGVYVAFPADEVAGLTD